MDKYDGLMISLLKHIKGVSTYNSNYYIGLNGELLYGLSDDDMTTEWFLIRGDSEPKYIGYSTVGGDEKILYQEKRVQ